jgi:hypothetical protein
MPATSSGSNVWKRQLGRRKRRWEVENGFFVSEQGYTGGLFMNMEMNLKVP